MKKEYDVLYKSEFCSAWEYMGNVSINEIQPIMRLKGPDCEVLHICVYGYLTKDEKEEIANRHGI